MEVAPSEQGGGRQLRATRDACAGEVLLSVPFSAVFADQVGAARAFPRHLARLLAPGRKLGMASSAVFADQVGASLAFSRPLT